VSNQNRQWNPIAAGDWELAALHETVMAFERNHNPAAITPFLTAIACLQEIVSKTLPPDSEGWARLDRLGQRVRDVVEGERCGS
jgi:hypothetical protein